jgi:DNA (cytosine-5)-methyltransferase 1
MALKSIDLFTGVGGITLALSGIAHPVLYCDVDPIARQCIEFNISRKLLPDAPISEDVQTLTNPPKADIVVSGWPCIGFSNRGHRAGFEQPGSALFYRMLDVLDKSGAKAVFQENVPGVVKEIDSVIHELSVKRGFQLRWECVSARDVGAPHERKRWFCLGIKKGSKLERMKFGSLYKYNQYDWSGKGPNRTYLNKYPVDEATSKRATEKRWGLMGNSVTPDAVRLAFCRLFSGGACGSLDKNMPLTFANITATTGVAAASCRGMSVVHPGSKIAFIVDTKYPLIKKNRDVKLAFDPKVIKLPSTRSPQQTTEVLKSVVKANKWATPRHGMTASCRVLTFRSSKDLPTQVRYEKGTAGRQRVLSGKFVEWIMGYPLGFTDVDHDER